MDYQLRFTDTSKSPFVVKPYTANGPAHPNAATPLYTGAVSANSSLVVLGKGAFDYGQPIQENLLHLLENFSNSTRPYYPIEGQLWFKNTDIQDPINPTDPQLRGMYVFDQSVWRQVVVASIPMTENMNAGLLRITNLGAAVDAADAVSKQYADGRYVLSSGSPSLQANLNLNGFRITNLGEPTDPLDAISQSHADGRYLRTVGGTMLGVLSMNDNKVTNLADATNPQDALSLRVAQQLFASLGAGGAIDGGTF